MQWQLIAAVILFWHTLENLSRNAQILFAFRGYLSAEYKHAFQTDTTDHASGDLGLPPFARAGSSHYARVSGAW